MQAMPGNRGTGRRGLHTADDGGGTDFQGEAVGTGDLPGVQEGILTKGVTDGAPPIQAPHDERGVGAGGATRKAGETIP